MYGVCAVAYVVPDCQIIVRVHRATALEEPPCSLVCGDQAVVDSQRAITHVERSRTTVVPHPEGSADRHLAAIHSAGADASLRPRPAIFLVMNPMLLAVIFTSLRLTFDYVMATF